MKPDFRLGNEAILLVAWIIGYLLLVTKLIESTSSRVFFERISRLCKPLVYVIRLRSILSLVLCIILLLIISLCV